MTDTLDAAGLAAELAELEAANEAATGWGAAVGARQGRINAIKRILATPPVAPPTPTSDDGGQIELRPLYTASPSVEALIAENAELKNEVLCLGEFAATYNRDEELQGLMKQNNALMAERDRLKAMVGRQALALEQLESYLFGKGDEFGRQIAYEAAREETGWTVDRDMLAEAASDPALSDGAVRALCVMRQGEIMPELRAWAEAALAAAPSPEQETRTP